FEGAPNDLEGLRLAALAGGKGFAVLAPARSTKHGSFVGAIDYVPPSSAAALPRWGQRKGLELDNFGASDHAGVNVSLAWLKGPKDNPAAVVASPGANSRAVSGQAAGQLLRAGAIDSFEGATPKISIGGDHNDAQLGTTGAQWLDFDGDGRLE